MVHLGRAIGDAPDGRFPATRLAALALDVAVGGHPGPEARRSRLPRARPCDRGRPAQRDLIEALAALSLRVGDADGAEARARSALAIEPDRPRVYALLSEARSRAAISRALSRRSKRG